MQELRSELAFPLYQGLVERCAGFRRTAQQIAQFWLQDVRPEPSHPLCPLIYGDKHELALFLLSPLRSAGVLARSYARDPGCLQLPIRLI
ncbi:hypothetical protein KDX38_26550, partial [Pseudomonas sp. CDFA 602]|uniref:hypothetical protein n=1 Tax=Pseudomonas californiensis TaxID=2829823 RepID=UPI001E505E19